MTIEDDRSPEEIERDITRTREDMDQTIAAIQSKLSPGQLMDQLFDMFRSGPGSMMSDLGRSMRNHPIPYALTGIGLAWLMASSSRGRGHRGYDYRDYDDGAFDAYGTEADYDDPDAWAGRARVGTAGWPSTDSAAAGRDNGASAGSTLHQVRQGASHLAASARDAVQETAESARGALDEVGTRIGRQWRRLRRGTDHQTSRLGSQARGARQMAMERTGRAGRQVQHAFEEQPLLLVGLGLAVGAAIGAMLPATRREDELFGPTRDDVARRAAELGRRQWEKAKVVADEALTAARREADEHGVNLKEGEDQLNRAVETARSVSTAAMRAAREEAERQGLYGDSKPSTGPAAG